MCSSKHDHSTPWKEGCRTWWRWVPAYGSPSHVQRYHLCLQGCCVGNCHSPGRCTREGAWRNFAFCESRGVRGSFSLEDLMYWFPRMARLHRGCGRDVLWLLVGASCGVLSHDAASNRWTRTVYLHIRGKCSDMASNASQGVY